METTAFEIAISKAQELPEETREQLGRDVLFQIEKLERLRADLQVGIDQLNAGQGNELTSTRLFRKPAAAMANQHKGMIIWSPRAQEDLIEIWGYLLRVAGREIADRLLREIKSAADRVAAVDPRMHRVRSDIIRDLPGGLRSVSTHPYVLFYRINAESDGEGDVEIIRVLHQHRDLPIVLREDRA